MHAKKGPPPSRAPIPQHGAQLALGARNPYTFSQGSVGPHGYPAGNGCLQDLDIGGTLPVLIYKETRSYDV